MNPAEVRRALRLSQDELAQTLQIGQGSVAKIERRANMYVSALRRLTQIRQTLWHILIFNINKKYQIIDSYNMTLRSSSKTAP
jgi:hypothetical protein